MRNKDDSVKHSRRAGLSRPYYAAGILRGGPNVWRRFSGPSRVKSGTTRRQLARDPQIVLVQCASTRHGAIVAVNAAEGDHLAKDLGPDPGAHRT